MSDVFDRVLIVEDEPVLAMSLEDALRDRGAADVVTVDSAAEAMAILADRAPTLLILDMSLADSDAGYGLAEIALQLFNPPPRLIFSTGSPERVPPALASRGHVFSKPYSPDDLATFAAGL